MVGRILDHVPGHTNIGCSRNFVHLVTGHIPGRINRNGTVDEGIWVMEISTVRRFGDSANAARHTTTAQPCEEFPLEMLNVDVAIAPQRPVPQCLALLVRHYLFIRLPMQSSAL